jgi:hypothetical protein
MVYIKIMKDDTIIAVEALPSPVYVGKQRNGVVVRCPKFKAQGILSANGDSIYQLENKDKLDNASLTAIPITTTEYQNLAASLDELPSEEPENEVEVEATEEPPLMTIAEMRARILALEEMLYGGDKSDE